MKEQSVAWAQNSPLVKWEEPRSSWSTDFCRKYKKGSLKNAKLMSLGSGTSSTHPCRCPAELASDGLCGVLSPGQATRGLCVPLRGRAKHALLTWMISLREPASSWFKVDRVFLRGCFWFWQRHKQAKVSQHSWKGRKCHSFTCSSSLDTWVSFQALECSNAKWMVLCPWAPNLLHIPIIWELLKNSGAQLSAHSSHIQMAGRGNQASGVFKDPQGVPACSSLGTTSKAVMSTVGGDRSGFESSLHTSCVPLGKLLKLSVPQLSHL